MKALVETVDRPGWLATAARFADYSYRQAWDFGVACARRLGACSEHVAIRRGGSLLGLADVRIKRVPLVGSGVAYITGGPLVREDGAGEAGRLAECVKALLEEFVGRRGLVLRVQPALGGPDWNAAQERVFADLGFLRAENWPTYRTMLLAIDRPVEQVRKGLAQKWRNCLNRAERNGLSVRSGTGEALFEEFGRLYRDLRQRKTFGVDLDADFHAVVQAEMPEADRFRVSLAEENGQAVAGHVSSVLGDTCVYLLGATNEQGLQNKASYLLQWQTILAAQERGCRWYDLGGIDPDGNPGVYHFKEGLGGLDVTAAGPFEMAPAGLRRHLVKGCERMYRSVRTLCKGVCP